jgi:hypothetical protein
LTAPTGSPIAETGMDVPTFSTVTSAAVMTFSAAAGSFDPAAGIAWACRTGEASNPAINPQVAITAAWGRRKERASAGSVMAIFMNRP